MRRLASQDVVTRPAVVVCTLAVFAVVMAGAPPRLLAAASPAATTPAAAPDAAWFQATEQALMDAVAAGDHAAWERVLDASFVATSEEGEVIARKDLLASLRGLPPGLKGGIAVRELTVQDAGGGVAIVRYLADEWETVFGQRLTTKYRTTDTFRRSGGAWTLLASHTSVVTADPPAQPVDEAVAKSLWPRFVGAYRLLPDGWTLHVELRDGKLFAGRDPAKLRPMIPLAPDAFVISGSLGDYVFVRDAQGRATHIVELRKFEPLVWTRQGG